MRFLKRAAFQLQPTLSLAITTLLLLLVAATCTSAASTTTSTTTASDAPVSTDPPYTGSSSGNDTCHVDGAALYVRAVITHTLADAEAVPAEEDIHRYEGPPGFMVLSAANRQELVASCVAGPQAIFGGPLYEGRAPVYSVVNATSVVANYTIEAGLLNGTLPLTTAKIIEYFDYKDPEACLIQTIVAYIYTGET